MLKVSRLTPASFRKYEKPDVDSIDGLSPSIPLTRKQKAKPSFDGRNGQQRLMTIPLVFLYARVGVPIVPNGHGAIQVVPCGTDSWTWCSCLFPLERTRYVDF